LVSIGPTLYVDIGFDPAYKPGDQPQLPFKGARALVDTGATECCIDSTIAMALNLPIVDRRRIGGAGGAHLANIHLAQLHCAGLNYTVHGGFAAVELAAGGQSHQVLIGRTFLRGLRLVYEGHTGMVFIEHP
jgi:predicted aspartyl protease